MPLLTEKQLCESLKVCHAYIWKCRKQGMPFIPVGATAIRYNLDEVLAWMNQQYERKAIGA